MRTRLAAASPRSGEFVANALRHTASAQPGGQFLVEVRRCSDSATIALMDQGGLKEPTIPDLDDMSECGRGLYTVQVLANELTWSGSHASRTFTATFKDGSR
ncbi:ATP-binding protein [Actinoallomurus sp. CA-150999]|uniref:ATP-binding protein n=1 Tax=Actinoallomurus sp. CA-150999 TaxID=3239887 RepID=UPI003D8B13F6